MNRLLRLFSLTKRQKFVIAVLFLSVGVFVSEFLTGYAVIASAVVLSLITSLLLYIFVREDIKDSFTYPIFILPFFFTLAFVNFYPLVPTRFLTKIIITSLYALGIYSLLLTENIFAVSSSRTINLMRSARIVSFVLTIVVLFLLTNIIFSVRLPFFVAPIAVFVVMFLLNFQSLWTYNINKGFIQEASFLSALIAVCGAELSLALSLWPVNASIYSLFLTGIFYSYSGLAHAWAEKRLFRGVLWEYIWVGFLAILILIFFTKWGA